MFRFACGAGRVYVLTVIVVLCCVLTYLLFSRDRWGAASFKQPIRLSGPIEKKKKMKLSLNMELLNQSKIKEVQTFLFFIGYPRSGHSIVAACLDAHPDAIIAHEFNLFRKLSSSELQPQLFNRTVLYSSLYQNSVKASKTGWRSPYSDKKGYTLHINSSWQGKIRKLRVIGDKSGAITARTVHDSPVLFGKMLGELKRVVGVPVKILHVVRNPYDMVATRLLFSLSSEKGKKAKFTTSNPIKDKKTINQAIYGLRTEAEGVKYFRKQWKTSILEIHYVDYIHDTRHGILKICAFLKIDCEDHFLKACEKATFKRPSYSRQVLSWSKEHKKKMKQLISDFSFFKGYSFKSE